LSHHLPDEQIWTYKADSSILGDLRDRIADYLRTTPLDEKKAMRMTLCADEAAANIIEHSVSPSGEPLDFKITAKVEEGFIKIIISDNGIPFNPTKAPLVDIHQHIRSGKKGGLGIHLMRLTLDILEYAREGDCNHFTLGMRLV